jgi:hypothetical protein
MAAQASQIAFSSWRPLVKVIVACAGVLLFGLAAWQAKVFFAGGNHPTPGLLGSTPSENQGAKKMSALELSITPDYNEVLVGAPLPVRITVKNSNTVPADVPSPAATYEFNFTLTPVDGKGKMRMLNLRSALYARRPEPQPLPKMTQPLPAGESIDYRLDLSSYATPPIEAGKYMLTVDATLGGARIKSQGAPLAVVPPNVKFSAFESGDSQKGLSSIFGHQTSTGDLLILHQEMTTAINGEPIYGTSYSRVSVPKDGGVSGVAVAAEFDQSVGTDTRWFAWLQGSGIGAGAAQEKALFIRVNPVPTELHSVELQSVGWQADDNSASFVVIGRNDQNHLTLGEAHFQISGQGTVRRVPLPVNTIPLTWAAGFSPENGGRYVVVTPEVNGGSLSLHAHLVSINQEKVERSTLLLETPAPFVSMSLNPILNGRSGSVDVLLGPEGKDDVMTLLRLSLGGGPPLAKWTFPAPSDEHKAQPSAWAITSKTLTKPVVMAKVGDQLMIHHAADSSGWTTLATGAAKADHLRLEVIAGSIVWAVWTDSSGIVFKRID